MRELIAKSDTKLELGELKKDYFMIFIGIAKEFCLTNKQQYDTIGRFWDEMANLYGLENLLKF